MYWACLGATPTSPERKASGGWLPLAPIDKQVRGLGITLVSSYRLARSRSDVTHVGKLRTILVVVSGLCETLYCNTQSHFRTETLISAAVERAGAWKLESRPRGSPSGDYLNLRETFCLRSGFIQWLVDMGMEA